MTLTEAINSSDSIPHYSVGWQQLGICSLKPALHQSMDTSSCPYCLHRWSIHCLKNLYITQYWLCLNTTIPSTPTLPHATCNMQLWRPSHTFLEWTSSSATYTSNHPVIPGVDSPVWNGNNNRVKDVISHTPTQISILTTSISLENSSFNWPSSWRNYRIEKRISHSLSLSLCVCVCVQLQNECVPWSRTLIHH